MVLVARLVRRSWSWLRIAISVDGLVMQVLFAFVVETGLPLGVQTVVESQVNGSAEFSVPFPIVSKEVLVDFPLVPKVFVAEVVLAFLPYFRACALLLWVYVVEQFLPFVRRALVVVAHGPW